MNTDKEWWRHVREAVRGSWSPAEGTATVTVGEYEVTIRRLPSTHREDMAGTVKP